MRWNEKAFWILVGAIAMLIILSLIGCGGQAPDVHCDCPEIPTLTKPEKGAFRECVEKRDVQECLDLYL